ncbi:hypothetical protein GJ496_006446 [Pomphorhynchus laevis]|nr:hypothetical protein GJ496_006446 [Pomphorhynchus laevis]
MAVVRDKLHNASSDVPKENCTLQPPLNLVCSVDSVYNRAIPEERAEHLADRSCWVPSFCNLMSLGKTLDAMRFLANPDNISPVMSLDQEIGGMTV